MTAQISTVWKVVELSGSGRLMTLCMRWRGGRALLLGEWMQSEPFWRRLNGRPNVKQQGFWAFPTLEAGLAFFDSYHTGADVALVVGEASGTTPQSDGTVLCHQLKIIGKLMVRAPV